jgi:hypothetical protein
VSQKFKTTIFGGIAALVIVVGGGLTTIHADTHASTASVQHARTTISYHGADDMTALAELQKSYHVQTKTYSGLGQEVTGINGVLANSKHYWAFYVNGKMAQVGADTYVTKKSDTITWKLDSL